MRPLGLKVTDQRAALIRSPAFVEVVDERTTHMANTITLAGAMDSEFMPPWGSKPSLRLPKPPTFHVPVLPAQ